MAKFNLMKASAVLLPTLLILAGCGKQSALQPARPALNHPVAAVGARAVAPDTDAVFANDLRRAQYWSNSDDKLRLVMSIQVTGLNTQKISAAANVFFSPEAFYAAKPSVFVARHYGSAKIAQYLELTDFNKFANKLPAIGAFAVKSAEAWDLAKTFTPAGNAPACPTDQPCPKPSATTAKRFFTSTRAFLIQPQAGGVAQGGPSWVLYADKQKFTIDAQTKAVVGPAPQVNPDDRLNGGDEVDYQRASTIWLPTNPMQANNRPEPQGTN